MELRRKIIVVTAFFVMLAAFGAALFLWLFASDAPVETDDNRPGVFAPNDGSEADGGALLEEVPGGDVPGDGGPVVMAIGSFATNVAIISNQVSGHPTSITAYVGTNLTLTIDYTLSPVDGPLGSYLPTRDLRLFWYKNGVVISRQKSIVLNNISDSGTYSAQIGVKPDPNKPDTYFFYDTQTVQVTILQKTLYDVMVGQFGGPYQYTGGAQTPAVALDPSLTPNDYTLTWSNNVNVGTATLTVTPRGNCNGSPVYRYFQIVPRPVAVNWGTLSFPYDGSPHSPSPTVNTGIGVGCGVNLSGGGHTNVGAYPLSVSPTNANFTFTNGSATMYVTARTLTRAMIASIVPCTYDGKEQTPAFTVTDNVGGRSIIKDSDYTFAWSDNINAGTGRLTLTPKGNYGGAPVVCEFTIDQKSLAVTWDQTTLAFVYDGKAHAPSATPAETGVEGVTCGAEIIGAQTDAGEGYVAEARPLNANFKFTDNTRAFSIAAKKLTEDMVGQIAGEYVYNGRAHTPTCEIADTVDGASIITAADYALNWENNVNAGTARLTVTPQRNYSGDPVVRTFTVLPKTLTEAMVAPVDDAGLEYDGGAQYPTVTVADGEGDAAILSANDYTLSWENNVRAGVDTARVVVTPQGNYAGVAIVRTFSIAPKSIAVIWDSVVEFAYTGETYAPAASAPTGVAGVVCEIAVDGGQAAAGTYEATASTANTDFVLTDINKTFTIHPAEITDVTITGYDGIFDASEHDAATALSAATVNAQPLSWRFSSDGTNFAPEMPRLKDAGAYTVYYEVSAPNHNARGGSFAASVAKRAVTVEIAPKPYTGGTQTAAVPASEYFTVAADAGGIDAGEYDVTLALTDPVNCEWSGANVTVSGERGELGTLKWTIERATNYWTDGPTLTDTEYGAAVSPRFAAAFGSVTVSYRTADGTPLAGPPTAVGEYTAVFAAAGTENYTALAATERTFRIAPKAVRVTIADKSSVYGAPETALNFTVETALAYDDTADSLGITLTKAAGANAGKYPITGAWQNAAYAVTFTDGLYTIDKAVYDMSGVAFTGATVAYDGSGHSLEINGVLPDGVTVAYDGNGQTDAGAHTVTAKFAGDAVNYEPIAAMTATLEITRAVNEWMTAPVIGDITYGEPITTDGSARFGNIVVLYETADGVFAAAAPVNAGTYAVRFEVAGTDNYTGLTATTEFTINKSTYDLSGVTLTSATVTYNGEKQSLAVTGTLPDGVTVSYEGNGNVTVGEYAVTAKFAGDTDNYEPIPDMTATLTIAKAVYDLSGIVFADANVTYTGESLNLEISGTLPDGVTVRYDGNGNVTAGEYVVTAKFAGDADNYELIPDMTATLTIAKAVYDLSGIAFADASVIYTGDSFDLQISGTLPDGVTVSYEGNGNVEVGEYVVTAKFAGDADNYEPIPDMTATLTIAKAVYDLSGIAFADASVTYTGDSFDLQISGTLPDGVTVSYEGNGNVEVGEYVVTAKFTGDADNYELIPDMTAILTIESTEKGGETQPPPVVEPISPDGGGPMIGLIVGLSVGGLLLLAAGVILIIYIKKRRKNGTPAEKGNAALPSQGRRP